MSRHWYILLFYGLVSPFIACAQKDSIVYFKNNRVTNDTAKADFYRVVDSKNGDIFGYTEYHKDGTWIKATGKVSLADPIKVGDEKYFYKTGKLADINHYENGRLATTIGYYQNGVLMHVLKSSGKWPWILVAYDADSAGTVHIINGNGARQETDSIRAFHITGHYTMTGPYKDGLKDGIWKGFDYRGFLFEEKYEAGRLIDGTTKTPNGHKYRYNTLYSYPKFSGDMDKFEKDIIPALKNIADTIGLRFVKTGYLQLSYIIDEDGRVNSIRGFKKDGRGPVTLDLATDLPKIEPARLRGAPISYKIYNNSDHFIRDGFKVIFGVAPILKGTVRVVSQ